MGGKGGGKKGGGGGSIDVDVDAEVDSSMVLDIVGLDDVQITTNSTNRLEVPDPIQTRSELAITEPIDTRLTLSVPDTIRTEQRSEFAITEPIVTQMSASIDVKPIVLDLCLTVGIKDLPRVCISRPYDRHVGLSLFGREVIGFTWCGSSQLIIDDVRSHPFVAGIADGPAPHGAHDDQHRGSGRGPVVVDPIPVSEAGGRGVRFVID